MSDLNRRPTLYVEGSDDQHVLVHLLKRHGFNYDAQPWPLTWPKVEQMRGVDSLLDGMVDAIGHAFQQPVGFVLDADLVTHGDGLDARWASARNRLLSAEVSAPETLPSDGLIVESVKFKTSVGVWIMPDNQRDGSVEDFLRELIDEQDSLIGHADAATSSARTAHNATFGDSDVAKATLHTWLAWQKEPGKPYGQAIAAHYFRHDSPAALAFVDWFRQLYGL